MEKIEIHTKEFIKREAKKIKKELNITHLKALEEASIRHGFKNWNNFLIEEGKRLSASKKQINTAIRIPTYETHPYRNLLIEATNILIRKKLIMMDVDKTSLDVQEDNGHLITKVFGHTSAILWRHIGYDEIVVYVWWKYDHSKHPQANLSGNQKERFTGDTPLTEKRHYRKFVGIIIGGWIERRKGKHLMGNGSENIMVEYTRRGEKEDLQRFSDRNPKGYLKDGKFFF